MERNNRDLSRQGFLGTHADALFSRLNVGLIGLCGGGSHVAQQLAHLGVFRMVLIDPDIVEASNLNRMVGAHAKDAVDSKSKVEVVAREIRAVNPDAQLEPFCGFWQQHDQVLRGCDVIFGCVDSFAERAQLEAFSRRFLIPYIDIGMDVSAGRDGFVISGQVIVSIPGNPCMRCLGYLNDELIAQEAQQYGQAGGKPQVVWPNGALASTAVGLFVTLFTPWNQANVPLFIEYDGTAHRLFPSNKLAIARHECRHYPPEEVGDPFFGTVRTTKISD